jgi:hypothetical protein
MQSDHLQISTTLSNIPTPLLNLCLFPYLLASCYRQLTEDKQLDEPLLGVLRETALNGTVRYQWQLLLPLLTALMDQVLGQYAEEIEVEVGMCMGVGAGFRRLCVCASTCACV